MTLTRHTQVENLANLLAIRRRQAAAIANAATRRIAGWSPPSWASRSTVSARRACPAPLQRIPDGRDPEVQLRLAGRIGARHRQMQRLGAEFGQ